MPVFPNGDRSDTEDDAWFQASHHQGKGRTQIVSLICDEKIFDSVPVKKEVKAVVSGIYVLDVKGLHGKTEAAPEKKKGFFKRMIASAQEKAGAKPVK